MMFKSANLPILLNLQNVNGLVPAYQVHQLLAAIANLSEAPMSVLDKFSTTVFYDPESAGYVAVCDEIPGVSAFGATRADALREFETVLDMAVDTYRAEGWPLPAPKRPSDPALPSGEFRVRLPRYVHALLARRSEAEGVSQNTLVVALLAQGLASGPPALTVHDASSPSPSLMRPTNTVSRVVRTTRKP